MLFFKEEKPYPKSCRCENLTISARDSFPMWEPSIGSWIKVVVFSWPFFGLYFSLSDENCASYHPSEVLSVFPQIQKVEFFRTILIHIRIHIHKHYVSFSTVSELFTKNNLTRTKRKRKRKMQKWCDYTNSEKSLLNLNIFGFLRSRMNFTVQYEYLVRINSQKYWFWFAMEF